MTNTDIGPRPEEPYGIGQGQDSEAQFVRILEWEEARADKAEAEVAALREMWQAKEGQLDIKDDYIGELQGQIAALKEAIPEGMKHCKIVFRSCDLGHGWLTATNWSDFDCPTCRYNQQAAKNATMRGMLEYLLAQLEGSDALSNGEIIDIKKALEDGR